MYELKHAYKPSVPQVRYNHTLDKNAPKQYWRDISAIANFIGASLIFPSSSTIVVAQCKEKFGGVCVYCQLAEDERVTRKWEITGGTRKSITVAPDFKEQCHITDAIIYRRTYMQMFDLVPHYYSAIISNADYPGLLCYSKQELDELLTSPNYCSSSFDNDKKDLLYKICGFE